MNLFMIPWANLSLLPLDLEKPTDLNTGGYMAPRVGYCYSPIDLAVAGLEAMLRDLRVTRLSSIFNGPMIAPHEIQLGVTMDNGPIVKSVSYLFNLNDKDLTRILRKNAPLTIRNLAR